MWHVSSRSGVATLRTATHLLLTYSVFTGRMPFLPPNQQRQRTAGSGRWGLGWVPIQRRASQREAGVTAASFRVDQLVCRR